MGRESEWEGGSEKVFLNTAEAATSSQHMHLIMIFNARKISKNGSQLSKTTPARQAAKNSNSILEFECLHTYVGIVVAAAAAVDYPVK